MIVIPMAGISKRFTIEGYKVPKFMLKLKKLSLFKHSLLSFKNYFTTDKFLFIALDFDQYHEFLANEINELGIQDFKIILLKDYTRGQAETVYKGLEQINDTLNENEDLIIFNIDTFRPNFIKPKFKHNIDGYLEVFVGEGSNWSYVKKDILDTSRVIETAEKKSISNLCCTGLYYFKSRKDFISSFHFYEKNSIMVNNELYIAPLYNFLIKNNKYISYDLIKREDVIFCGTPDEYKSVLT